MKAAAFAYHRPDAVEEAVDLLAEYGDDAKILAGGQSLVPMLAMRLTHFDNLIDIARIDELVGFDLCDSEIRIGAATAHAFVGMDDEVADSVPLLTLATPYIGHFQIRTRGTLGGAIAHADPAAADEILTAVRFPVWGARSGFAVEEYARRQGDFAIAGAAVAVELDDESHVSRCGIGLLGLGSTPLRGSAAEEAVLGRPVGDITAAEIGRLAIGGLDDIPADLQGSAAYRAKVGATMVARAWDSATAEASDA
jgi:aerobic carbon-monoxide dehydrogenase medium subunit